MYSEELKQLIDAAVTDGKVTEKEMKVIARRAKAEGVDMDELEIYIDSCIQKKSMEGSEWNQVADRLEKAKKINAQERAERRKYMAQERAARRAFRAEHPEDFENTLKSIANVASETVSGFASGEINIGGAADIAKTLFEFIKPKTNFITHKRYLYGKFQTVRS